MFRPAEKYGALANDNTVMVRKIGALWDRFVYRAAMQHWSRAADTAVDVDLVTLREIRTKARALRRPLNRFLHEADGRLAMPVIGSDNLFRPPGADWTWRPDMWRGPIAVPGHAAVPNRTEVAPGATIFHDCQHSELTVRQIRNTREDDCAPFGFRMDVFRFDGKFLSLVLDLPDEAAQGLKLRHLVRMTCSVELEHPIEIFARLNVKHGPNHEQVVRELSLHEPEVMVEFDLAYTKLNERRVERLWLDLIFQGPEMNQIVLRDLTFARRPRAEV